MLEAAHLPGASWRGGANTADDGILLRADLHRLLDAGLLTIEAGVVRVQAGSYAALDGLRIGRPSSMSPRPPLPGASRGTSTPKKGSGRGRALRLAEPIAKI